MAKARSQNPELREPQRLLIECERVGATCLPAVCANDGVSERSSPVLEGDDGGIDLMLVFNGKRFGLKDALYRGRDFLGGETIGAVENPHGLDHGHNADKARVLGR